MVLKDEYHDVILASYKSPILAPEADAVSVSTTLQSRSRTGGAGSHVGESGADGSDAHTALCSRVSMAFEDRLEAIAREEMTEFLQVLGIGDGDSDSGEGGGPLQRGLELLNKRSGVIGGFWSLNGRVRYSWSWRGSPQQAAKTACKHDPLQATSCN